MAFVETLKPIESKQIERTYGKLVIFIKDVATSSLSLLHCLFLTYFFP